MELYFSKNKPVIKTKIDGSEISIRFSDKHKSKVKENIIEILTLCYEKRITNLIMQH